MSRWSDAFHAHTAPLTHETHGDTCADAGSHTDPPDPAQVSSSVPCVAAGNGAGRALHGQGTKREARDPTGWRCLQCHPPHHLGASDVREMRT